MANRLSVDESARARLRDAQKAEATALKAVEAAELVRSRAMRSFESAIATVSAAQAALVRVSGVDRAALLLDVPVKDLRRVLRENDMGPSAPSVPSGGASPETPQALDSTES